MHVKITTSSLCRKRMETMETRSIPSFHKKIAELSLQKYKELPRKGKPRGDKEWTPLAAVVCSEGTELTT